MILKYHVRSDFFRTLGNSFSGQLRWAPVLYLILLRFGPLTDVVANWMNIEVQVTGSGDTLLRYLMVGVNLIVALTLSLVLPARKAPSWATIELFTRLFLAATLIEYGFLKVFQLQMSQPGITRLTKSLGDSSPMGILWTFVGASPPYQMILGWIEVLGGLMILTGPTRRFGTLLCLVTTSQIFLLNLCYDVPVKLGSLHYFLMALFLSRTYLKEIVFTTERDGRWKALLQLGFAIYFIGTSLNLVSKYPDEEQGPLAGIWVASQPHEIKHLLFPWPDVVAFEKFDGSRRAYPLKQGEGWLQFGEHRVTCKILDGRMSLDGQVGETILKMDFIQRDLQDYNLRKRNFRWVQERPYNR